MKCTRTTYSDYCGNTDSENKMYRAAFHRPKKCLFVLDSFNSVTHVQRPFSVVPSFKYTAMAMRSRLPTY